MSSYDPEFDGELSEALVSRGLLSREDVERCLAIQARTSPMRPLALVLHEQGLFSKERMQSVLAAQAKRASSASVPSEPEPAPSDSTSPKATPSKPGRPRPSDEDSEGERFYEAYKAMAIAQAEATSAPYVPGSLSPAEQFFVEALEPRLSREELDILVTARAKVFDPPWRPEVFQALQPKCNRILTSIYPRRGGFYEQAAPDSALDEVFLWRKHITGLNSSPRLVRDFVHNWRDQEGRAMEKQYAPGCLGGGAAILLGFVFVTWAVASLAL